MLTDLDKLEQYLVAHNADYDNENLLRREVAYKLLYDAFRNLELESGVSVSTVWLSKILGISRTPVREALQQLSTDGLIQIIQGQAVTIAARSAQEVFSALRVRELLEPENARLCATGIEATALSKLQELTHNMEEAARKGDRIAWSQADKAWHEVLCESCPNKLLGQMVLIARNRMYHRGSDEHVPVQYLVEGTHEHRRIIDAIAQQDDTTAAQLMLDHLQQLKENLFKRLSGSR
jgi:DNA-binding GntR family transcriptional regulator